MSSDGTLRRDYERSLTGLGLEVPLGLPEALGGTLGNDLRERVYWPGNDPRRPNSLAAAGNLLDQAFWPAPENLLPLLPVDDMSIACAVCTYIEEPDPDEQEDEDRSIQASSPVVRWHLGAIDESHQGEFLDTDAVSYLRSVRDELAGRAPGLSRIADCARRYYAEYVETGNQPRKFEPRPIQLACQNVIIGFAVLQQDATFDGLRVRDYLTCEAAHLATHEGDRAMAALILCDAFQCGGTMELRFGDPGKDMRVPAALRRFGRVNGLALGEEDPLAITPQEARELFLAVTPIPGELRLRVADLFDRGLVTPERICFTLMSSIWTAVELDFILATSGRAVSILNGGAPFTDRVSRSAETETCRASVMAGMLHRRLRGIDGAGGAGSSVRVFEDRAAQVTWSMLDRTGMVAFAGVGTDLPWRSSRHASIAPSEGTLIAAPRALPTPSDYEQIRACASDFPDHTVVLLTPADMSDLVPTDIAVLACPDRLAEIDIDIERRLTRSRTGSA